MRRTRLQSPFLSPFLATFRKSALLILPAPVILTFASVLLSSPSSKVEAQPSGTQTSAPGRVGFAVGVGKPRPQAPGRDSIPKRRTAARLARTRRKGLTSNMASANSIFMEPQTYDSPGSPSGIAVADVNGDGHPDMLVANECFSSSCTNGGISVLLGNGDGTFQPAVSYSSGGVDALSIALADVNRDGHPDILVANGCLNGSCTSGGVSVLLGNGDGTFRPAVSYNSGGEDADSVAVADVNSDGFPDVLVANECFNSNCTNGGVSVLLGNGDGTFQAAVSYNSGGEDADSVAVADVNGDGHPDLLVANQCLNSNCTSGDVSVLLGNGNGTFQPAVSYNSGGEVADSVAVADVNGDGHPDLLVANQCLNSNCTNGDASVLLGNGNGTFQPAVSYNSGGQIAEAIEVADVNGDGRPDLLVTNRCPVAGVCGPPPNLGAGTVGVLLGNGNGTFETTGGYNSGAVFAKAIAVGDVNGDGHPDLLVANECSDGNCDTDGIVSVLVGTGNGKFQASAIYHPGGYANPGGYSPNAMAVADVNGDGKLDIVAGNDCASLDSEGNCVGGGVVGVLLGNGDGSFQPAVSYNSGGTATTIGVADLNGDGKPDIVVANGGVGVLLGNGDGTFQAEVSYASGGLNPVSIAVADVNGDGHPDLLVANECSDINCTNGAVSVLLGNGDGTFQGAVSYNSGGVDALSIAVADVNGDGHVDLLIANECINSGNCFGGGEVGIGAASVLLGNGDGTFQPAVSYNSGGLGTSAIAVADVNGDGHPDLLVVNECGDASNCVGNNVSVLLGNGDGTFQAAQATAISCGTNAVASQITVADFNGDGKLDLATGCGAALLLGNGDGTFQTPLNLNVASGPSAAIGDFNGDGSPDLAVGGGGVSILLNISASFGKVTTTTVTSSANPAGFGQSVTFTATVASSGGTPTGTVTFLNGAREIGTRTLSAGQASVTISTLRVGHHSITAAYAGNGVFQPSTSAPLRQIIKRATTTTDLVSSANPIAPDQPVTYTATVTSQYGGAVTGSVTFEDGKDNTIVPVRHGIATVTQSYTTRGPHPITAVYSGNSNNASSTSETLTENVETLPVTSKTAVTTSGSPSVVGQSVTFTATVTSKFGAIPNGELVTFYDGITEVGTGTTTSGLATFSTSSLSVKTHIIKAEYSGDATFKKSRGTVRQVVDAYTTTTTLSSSPNPSTFGQAVVLTAVVTTTGSTTPTGKVKFHNGAKSLGPATLDVSGTATLTVTKLPIGSDSLTATYEGDSSNSQSTSAVVVQTVN